MSIKKYIKRGVKYVLTGEPKNFYKAVQMLLLQAERMNVWLPLVKS